MLTSDNVLFASGRQRNALGDGTTSGIRKEFKVVRENVKKVASSTMHAFLIHENGMVRVTGQNDRGQLGLKKEIAYKYFVVPEFK